MSCGIEFAVTNPNLAHIIFCLFNLIFGGNFILIIISFFLISLYLLHTLKLPNFLTTSFIILIISLFAGTGTSMALGGLKQFETIFIIAIATIGITIALLLWKLHR